MAQKEKTPEQKARIAAASKAYYQANKAKCIEAKLKWIKEQGFSKESEYVKQAPYYQAKIKNNHPNKTKQLFNELPVEAKAILNMPNYFITPKAEVWTYSEKRQCYLQITQQQQRTGYKVFQPYINGKRVVRFTHIVMMETFVSPRPAEMEVDHIDMNRSNNNIENLRWLSKSENRQRRVMPKRGPYKKK